MLIYSHSTVLRRKIYLDSLEKSITLAIIVHSLVIVAISYEKSISNVIFNKLQGHMEMSWQDFFGPRAIA